MNSLVSKLKEMLKLEERRTLMSAELDSLTGKLSQLQKSLNLSVSSDSGTAAAPAKTRRGRKGKKAAGVRAAKPVRKGGKGRARRGAMKESILNELAQAGPGGIGVKELSDKLGVRNTAVHGWFNTTGKKVKQIKKVGTARYALTGGVPATATKAAKAPKTTRKRRTKRRAKAPKAPKATKAPKAAKPGKRGKRSSSGRGELMKAITSVLQKAGSKGMTVREISAKLNVPYKNVYIWFVTTGKKNKSIERIAPATYRMQS